ncbi:MAG: response regulator transcription factor [Candidatus Aquilonibacter sp.]
MRILIVEDDGPLRALLHRGLSEDGHVVDALADGSEAETYARATPYDVMVLDLNLPGEDGLSILGRMRKGGVTVPTLILTARDAVEDVIAGLDAGADDYLRKPFAFGELEARLRSVVRRPPAYEENVLRLGDIEFNRGSRTATRAGRVLPLTAKESAFLEILLQNAGHIVTRRTLEDRLWDRDSDRISNVLDVYARRLRRKLSEDGEPGVLQTVRGVGYRLETTS